MRIHPEALYQPSDAPSRAERLLIVPAAHSEVFATRFQLDMYELFHRTWGARLGHMIGTPATLLGAFVLLALLTSLPWPALLVLAVIAAFGLAVDKLATAIVMVFGAGLVALADLLVVSVGPSSWMLGLALIVGGCLIQTLSHLFEDIPPPHSGEPRFVPPIEWLRGVGVRETLRSAALTVGVFYWLELWATLRIWPLQILHLLMACGYHPQLRASIDAQIDQIVRNPLSDWRRPTT
jgi:uncharacterized membrane protein YGL010W